MNRSTFLKRLTGAVAALFVPWKVAAGEPEESLLEKLRRERLKKTLRGFEPRSFCCNEATLRALIEEGEVHDFHLMPFFKTVEVEGLPWINSAWIPDGEFRVNSALSSSEFLTKAEAREQMHESRRMATR